MLYGDCTLDLDSLIGCLLIVTKLMYVNEVTNCYNIFASLNSDEPMSLNYCTLYSDAKRCIIIMLFICCIIT